MASNELVGNIPTEELISFLQEEGALKLIHQNLKNVINYLQIFIISILTFRK